MQKHRLIVNKIVNYKKTSFRENKINIIFSNKQIIIWKILKNTIKNFKNYIVFKTIYKIDAILLIDNIYEYNMDLVLFCTFIELKLYLHDKKWNVNFKIV